ncbi:unnamed protein product [Notodromas monacha]|uniref:Phosphatidylserine synthase n=1 Tax=Notodromas monacha TaxID=399045 RepID=A0A7R9GGY9_9CRUS|nr:unnamed protein product [Notodromas monacha]CAG0920925.1 unnamed protein product [Notodromas monacha]
MAWGDSDYSGGEEASGGTEAPEWIPFSTTLVVRPPGLVGLLMGILSLTPFAVLVGFVTLIFFRRDLHTIFFLVGLLLNTVMNMILKPVIAQDRPDYNEHLRRYHGNSVSYGMPSHHSQFMWFFCFYMILFLMFRVKSVVPRGSGETAARQRWMYALFLLGAGASYSRVYLGYHTMEQVVVGAFVGSLFASAWFYIMQHYLSPCFLKILCHPSWVVRAEQLVEKTRESLNGHAAGDLFYHERRKPAHDWQGEKQAGKALFDDGTNTFFWRAHTLTVLFIILMVLVHVAIFEPENPDTDYNAKRGLVAMVLCFVLFGSTVMPDGPFSRPHPAFWRMAFSFSFIYELSLIFLLFQTPNDARKLLKHLDPSVGVPLEEKSYGGNCRIYDTDTPEDPYHNFWDKMDLFVPLHFFGWMLKTLILRDWWICTVLSISFELLEYTFEHQLPNFSECWWDHWILDALLCNGLGIYVGIQVLNFFSLRTYYWRGLWNIPTYRGKLKRIIAQFGPHSWIDFEWKPTTSLGRWFFMLNIIMLFSLGELNSFYLKYVLWIPPDNRLNAMRLVFMLLWGAVAIRETFQYLDDPECQKFGRQSWMLVTIVFTEFLLVLKCGWETVTKPLPWHIGLFWSVGFAGLLGWSLYNFLLRPKMYARYRASHDASSRVSISQEEIAKKVT